MNRLCLVLVFLGLTAIASAQEPLATAFTYLDRMMDIGTERKFVYIDADSGFQCFSPSNWLNPPRHPKGPMNISLDAACHDRPYSGMTCMRIHWDGTPGRGGPWNGIIFDTRPEWVGLHGPPVDLSTATHLTGWIRANRPDIRVKVFVGGGRNRFKQVYPGHEWTLLNRTEWTPFDIDLSHVPKNKLAVVQDGFAI